MITTAHSRLSFIAYIHSSPAKTDINEQTKWNFPQVWSRSCVIPRFISSLWPQSAPLLPSTNSHCPPRQHSRHPYPAVRLQPAWAERVLPAYSRGRQRASLPQLHRHPDHPCVWLRHRWELLQELHHYKHYHHCHRQHRQPRCLKRSSACNLFLSGNKQFGSALGKYYICKATILKTNYLVEKEV